MAACAAAGTGYCDLTGEVPFVRAAIDRHHATAVATGARIVNCCGFDSLPSDLGVWLVQRELEAQAGRGAAAVTALFEVKGAASGGTIASMFGLMDEAAGDRAIRRLLLDPYALDPAGTPRGDDRDVRGPGYDRTLGAFTAPFVMASVNARVVRRSHALRGQPWGRGWRYDERMGMPGTARGAGLALAITGGLAGFIAATQVPPLRRALEARLPKPGEGPSPAQRARGRYRTRLHGTVDGGEQCDDGNTVGGDGCSSTCQTEATPAGCGDGIVDGAEACDDGNVVGGDGCSSVCTVEDGGNPGDGSAEGGCCSTGSDPSGPVTAAGLMMAVAAVVRRRRARR